MDRKEVIKWLKIMKANLNSFSEVSNAKKIEALAEAIRLLKNEQSIDKIDCDHTDCINCVNHKYCDYEKSGSEKPNKSEIPTSLDDCISRDDVWDVMQELWGTSGELIDRLMSLPPVTPIKPKGHWQKIELPSRDTHECSECCGLALWDENNEQLTDFCPNCGADMRTSEENDV